MKISYNFVKAYVNVDGLSIKEISDRLTFAGVEVENVERLAEATNLVIGEVLTCENMPDSDHLHLTTVNCGAKYGVLHIVCGAPNVRKGLKVIVATDGAKLPGGIIKVGKIRGHESQGMLCSLLELGVESKFLSEKQMNGIEELPDDAEVGNEDVLGYLGLDDYIFDIKLLANRPDLYSIKNFAREIKTLFNRELYEYKVDNYENNVLGFQVSSVTEKCNQFSTRVIKDIKVGPSPRELVNILRAAGIRSINNIVDIGNYIMLVTGQPIHMYDLDKLPYQELIVKDHIEDDFVALDGKTYHVEEGDLVVTSHGQIMCLAGIMGAECCTIDENTKNVVVEVANFNYASIRRTSIRLGLSSDSAIRFIKGINPNQYDEILNLAAAALVNYAGAKEVGQINTYLKKPFDPRLIYVTAGEINKRLGTSFSIDDIIQTLERAFIQVVSKDGKLGCIIPDYRIDITDAADLSEEVIRIKGFNNVLSELPEMQLTVGALDENLAKKRIVREYLRGIGIDEALNYSLISEKESTQFNFLNKHEGYRIMNPLTDERVVLRTNLLPSMFESLTYNLNHSNPNVALFEVSDIFTPLQEKEVHLGFVAAGNDLRRGAMSGEQYNYYHVKGVIDGLLKLFDIDEKRAVIERTTAEGFHPGKAAQLKIDGKVCAVFGELHPSTKKELGYDSTNVVALEMNLSVLFDTKVSMKKAEQISRFPAVKRDFALVLNDKVTSKDVLIEVRKAGKELVRNVEVFDVYKGEHIEEGHYSLAISVYIGSFEKTLSDVEISSVEESIVNSLKLKFGAELRK